MAPKKTKCRPGESRVSAADVFMQWQKLSMKQRSAALNFTDTVLVARIMEALRHIQRHHEACLAAGFTLNREGGADPFKNYSLLGDIFCISVTHRTAKDDPNRTETDVGLQIKEDFLEQHDLFEQLRCVLPDLLEPRPTSRRSPMPRQHWKHLWGTLPTSFHALELQMAMTMEQALWAMAAAASQTIEAEPASVKPNVSLDDVVEEPWMIESAPNPKTAKAKKNKRGTKCKQHGCKEEHAGPRQELQDLCHDMMTVSESDPAKHNEQLSPCDEVLHGQSIEAGDLYAPCTTNGANVRNSKTDCCEIPASESSDDQVLIKRERNFSEASTMCEVHSDTAGFLAEDSEKSGAAGERHLQVADEVSADFGLSERHEMPASESSDDQALVTRERNCSEASTMCEVHSDTAGSSAEDSEESGAAGERHPQEADEVLADLGLSEMVPPAAIMPEQARDADCLADGSMNALGHDLSYNEQTICSPYETSFTSSGAPGLAGPPGLGAPPGLLAPWLLVGPDPSLSGHLSGLAPPGLLLPLELLAPPGLPEPRPACLQPPPSTQQTAPAEAPGLLPSRSQRFCGWCGHQHQNSDMRFCTCCGCRVTS